ncbi:AAA family ATPase [Aeromicrobium sp.]|uniref:AAA family ATPase n=1 Tax=Aeromicrobium sp. TaxID=1871063 RepID=UPI004034CFF9
MSDTSTALRLAHRLLAAGVPVVVVGPGDVPPSGWQSLTSAECDLSTYRPGVDALAMVGGHGIDAVDVDPKNGGSVDNLPPFEHFGMTVTPSGGAHYIVPSSGLGKIPNLSTERGPVGDYISGRTDGSGRSLLFLPGSARSKYPDGGYVEAKRWDVDRCLAAAPDPALLDALTEAGTARTPRARFESSMPERNPAEGVHWYAARVVADTLNALDRIAPEGRYWNNETYNAACTLAEVANHPGSGYSHDDALRDLLDHAPTDDGFGPVEHRARWASAVKKVDGGCIQMPDDEFAPIAPHVSGPYERLPLADLLDPNRPPREYVVDPMVTAGSSVALVAPAGHRKSLLLLRLALAVARGEPSFAGMHVPRARRVLYIDTENTHDDLRDRLVSFGVSQHDDLARLILVSLPPMAPLDTPRGGRELLEAVDAYGLEPGDLVVLDSYQRVTEAGENDSDTTRGYYRHTGTHLKARGLTVLRTDNTGKDVKKGARGSSGKRDDVDVEYLVESSGDYIYVSVGKARQRGITQMTVYVRTENGRTEFRSDRVPPKVSRRDECVQALDLIGLPDSTSQRAALDALGDAYPRDVVREAVALRKARTAAARADFQDA